MLKNDNLGEIGEDICVDYLLRYHYEILARNFQCALGEIDIIAKEKEEIVFIEVKTRSEETPDTAFSAVSKSKQERISKAASFFLARHPEMEESFTRFDAIAIVRNAKGHFQIHHIKEAFLPKESADE